MKLKKFASMTLAIAYSAIPIQNVICVSQVPQTEQFCTFKYIVDNYGPDTSVESWQKWNDKKNNTHRKYSMLDEAFSSNDNEQAPLYALESEIQRYKKQRSGYDGVLFDKKNKKINTAHIPSSKSIKFVTGKEFTGKLSDSQFKLLDRYVSTTKLANLCSTYQGINNKCGADNKDKSWKNWNKLPDYVKLNAVTSSYEAAKNSDKLIYAPIYLLEYELNMYQKDKAAYITRTNDCGGGLLTVQHLEEPKFFNLEEISNLTDTEFKSINKEKAKIKTLQNYVTEFKKKNKIKTKIKYKKSR